MALIRTSCTAGGNLPNAAASAILLAFAVRTSVLKLFERLSP